MNTDCKINQCIITIYITEQLKRVKEVVAFVCGGWTKSGASWLTCCYCWYIIILKSCEMSPDVKVDSFVVMQFVSVPCQVTRFRRQTQTQQHCGTAKEREKEGEIVHNLV